MSQPCFASRFGPTPADEWKPLNFHACKTTFNGRNKVQKFLFFLDFVMEFCYLQGFTRSVSGPVVPGFAGTGWRFRPVPAKKMLPAGATGPSRPSKKKTTGPARPPETHTTDPSWLSNENDTGPSRPSKKKPTGPARPPETHTTDPSWLSNENDTGPSRPPETHTTDPSRLSNENDTGPSRPSKKKLPARPGPRKCNYRPVPTLQRK